MNPEISFLERILYFEDIDFDNTYFYQYKKDRQVFFHNNKNYVYKFFSDNWEFADKTEEAINLGYYDNSLVPNFVALIKNKKGENKGYILQKIKSESFLSNIIKRKKLYTIIVELLKGKNLYELLKPTVHSLNNEKLIKLLYLIFKKACISKIIYTEISFPNIWVDNEGYFIIDLDSQRSFEWLFCNDKNDPEFIRKLGNKQIFNKNLKDLINIHNLSFPFFINKEKDINSFWKKFILDNKIKNYPECLISESI